MPEAADALRTGKLPRRCGLNVEAGGKQVSLHFNAETFFCAGVKLPDVEDADSPRVVFEERIAMLRDLNQSLQALFHAFLSTRASSAWESKTSAIRRWITAHRRPAGALGNVARHPGAGRPTTRETWRSCAKWPRDVFRATERE